MLWQFREPCKLRKRRIELLFFLRKTKSNFRACLQKEVFWNQTKTSWRNLINWAWLRLILVLVRESLHQQLRSWIWRMSLPRCKHNSLILQILALKNLMSQILPNKMLTWIMIWKVLNSWKPNRKLRQLNSRIEASFTFLIVEEIVCIAWIGPQFSRKSKIERNKRLQRQKATLVFQQT